MSGVLGWFSRAGPAPAAATVAVEEPKAHVPDSLLIFDAISPADQPFVDLFKAQTASFWSSEELKFELDATDLAKLPPKGRRLFEYILAFFATADGEVLENAVVNFLTESESLPIRMAYTAQVFFESIHIATYAKSLSIYIPDATRRTELTMAFKTDPLIKERDDWMTRYIGEQSGDPKQHKAKRLVAFACAEGLFFMSAFMVITWLRSCDLFPVFARANELISRDEWFHVKLGIARFRRLYGGQLDEIGLTEEDLVNIVKEAVELESRFAQSLVPTSIDADRFEGLRCEDLVLHIQNLGNEIISMLGITDPKLKRPWHVDASKLPPWVTWLQVQPKGNFYESCITSYSIPIAASEDPDRDVNF